MIAIDEAGEGRFNARTSKQDDTIVSGALRDRRPPSAGPSRRPVNTRLRAVQLLVLATVCWSISFATSKALVLAQQRLLPGSNTWFLSSFTLTVRFGIGALVMLLWHRRAAARLTGREWQQSLGLGLFGGAGMVLQMDGLSYVHASTSAFLTQFYCVVIPVWVALRRWRWPGLKVLSSSVLVLAGVSILSGMDWREMRLGRGELETLLGSVFFSGQILWLERPEYARNRMGPVTGLMFGVMTLVCLPVALGNTLRAGDWPRAAGSWPILLFLLALTLVCTLSAYSLMNYWQRHVTATEAGLIYCMEPVFASLSALFLPVWFSHLAGIDYLNETLTWHLLAGGGLITVANLLLHLNTTHETATSPGN